jgi:transcriptional regulator with XRE-family HTH domain
MPSCRTASLPGARAVSQAALKGSRGPHRRQRGLTQAELAQKIGTTRESIAAYEAGRVHISDDILIRFSLSLGVSADKLLGIAGKALEDPSTLRIMRRLKKIEKLPPAKQKAILQTLDMALQNVDQSKS